MSAAIGQQHGEMASEDVDALLSIRHLSGGRRELLKRVVVNSKRYYANPDAFDRAWADEVGPQATQEMLQA